MRGTRRINIPGGDERIYPNDRLQVIGTDEQLATLGKAMSRLEEETKDNEQQNWEHQEMRLKQFIIDADSPFLDKSIRHSGIRNQYNCLIVGIEKADGTLMSPDADEVLHQGEVIWVVGEEKDVAHLLDKTKEKANEP